MYIFPFLFRKPTFSNFMVNIVEVLLNSLHVLPSRKQHLSILKDVSGIIKPSRLTLLLGPPSYGKTTFLLALAGKLDPNLKVRTYKRTHILYYLFFSSYFRSS
ncbi:transcription factor [Lathyrus oleraceus]|uniref:Transcription factor n=1 Tax=Pisum sativum TaxID=3888 RepID=A0A9D4XTJ8_PEA|nr:transcription factor [Pisum sativum]